MIQSVPRIILWSPRPTKIIFTRDFFSRRILLTTYRESCICIFLENDIVRKELKYQRRQFSTRLFYLNRFLTFPTAGANSISLSRISFGIPYDSSINPGRQSSSMEAIKNPTLSSRREEPGRSPT